jgi:hypothetical protein
MRDLISGNLSELCGDGGLCDDSFWYFRNFWFKRNVGQFRFDRHPRYFRE